MFAASNVNGLPTFVHERRSRSKLDGTLTLLPISERLMSFSWFEKSARGEGQPAGSPQRDSARAGIL